MPFPQFNYVGLKIQIPLLLRFINLISSFEKSSLVISNLKVVGMKVEEFIPD